MTELIAFLEEVKERRKKMEKPHCPVCGLNQPYPNVRDHIKESHSIELILAKILWELEDIRKILEMSEE